MGQLYNRSIVSPIESPNPRTFRESVPRVRILITKKERLVLADAGGLRAGDADEIVRRDANRLLVRARLEHERLTPHEPAFDHHGIAPAAADRRCRSELELRKIAAKVVLGCEPDVVLADAKELA